MTVGAHAATKWIVGRPRVASLATTTKLKWTVCGHLFPTTRSTTWSRPMVAPTSALRDSWARTRASYSASFCRRKADGSADFARKRSDNMIDPAEAMRLTERHLIG